MLYYNYFEILLIIHNKYYLFLNHLKQKMIKFCSSNDYLYIHLNIHHINSYLNKFLFIKLVFKFICIILFKKYILINY
jgi:hypothetical protein